MRNRPQARVSVRELILTTRLHFLACAISSRKVSMARCRSSTVCFLAFANRASGSGISVLSFGTVGIRSIHRSASFSANWSIIAPWYQLLRTNASLMLDGCDQFAAFRFGQAINCAKCIIVCDCASEPEYFPLREPEVRNEAFEFRKHDSTVS